MDDNPRSRSRREGHPSEKFEKRRDEPQKSTEKIAGRDVPPADETPRKDRTLDSPWMGGG